MPNAMSNRDLAPNETCMVTGTLTFARIHSQIKGEELTRRDQQSRSKYPHTTPYTTITLVDPVVNYNVPGQQSSLETYVQGKFFVGKSGKYAGHQQVTLENKSHDVPFVCVRDKATGVYNETKLQADPVAGQVAHVIVRSFATKSGNNGISFDAVLFDEPLELYGGNSGRASTQSYLQGRGITVNLADDTDASFQDEPAVEAPQASVPEPAPFQVPAPQPVAYQQPVQQPAPQPVPQPQPFGFSQQAPAQQAYQQPAYQQPAPQAAPQPQPFGAPAQNPFIPNGVVDTPQGIRFDPNANN